MRQRRILFYLALGIAILFIFHSIFSEKKEVVKEEVLEIKEIFKVAIVLDDFGYNKINLSALGDLTVPVTIAVLPNTPYSKTVSRFAEEKGIEVILHLPMQPEGGNVPLEVDTVLVGMEDGEIRDIIGRALDSVPFAKGISNHMGSKATGDARTMTIIFEELKKRNMFFLDSFTSPDSVCGKIAEEKDVPCFQRDIFLDNSRETKKIEQCLINLVALKNNRNSAIGIGHDRMVTFEALKNIVPEMEKMGVKFVKLSDLADDKEK
ncbi:MAG: divergent polysaccharide deacetylase family protein [Candidatus Omnitrophota bacterium]